MYAAYMPADFAPMQSNGWLATNSTSSILTPRSSAALVYVTTWGLKELATATEMTASRAIWWKGLAASSMSGSPLESTATLYRVFSLARAAGTSEKGLRRSICATRKRTSSIVWRIPARSSVYATARCPISRYGVCSLCSSASIIGFSKCVRRHQVTNASARPFHPLDLKYGATTSVRPVCMSTSVPYWSNRQTLTCALSASGVSSPILGPATAFCESMGWGPTRVSARRGVSHAGSSRVHPAHARHGRDAADGDDVGGRAHVDLVAQRRLQHGGERLAHLRLETLVHFLLAPEVTVAVLHPLEIRRRHAGAVGENVGHDKDATLRQVLGGIGRRRAIGAFDDHLGLDLRSVVDGDLVLERRRDQDVDIRLEDVRALQRLAALKAVDRLVLADPLDQLGDVQSLGVVDAALPVGDADDGGPFLRQQISRDRADVAEPLHRDRGPLDREADVLRRLARRDHHAAAGRFATAERAAQFHRLAGDHRRRRVADVHRVGVH